MVIQRQKDETYQIQFTLKHVLQYRSAWWNYRAKRADSIRPAVDENVLKVLGCRTKLMGCDVYGCSNPNCEHTKVVCFTCKSRFCSTCGKKATEQWIEEQNATLPQCKWQHITFTMPRKFWAFFLFNRELLNIIFRTAANTLLETAKKKGLIIGIFAALHTFGRDLKWNVHVHISVTRGGYDEANDSWSEIYFTRKVIMPMWRYAVTNLLRQTYKAGELTIPDEYQSEISDLTTFNRFLNREYQKFWKVHFAQPKENHQHNVDYLGRYIKRPALANARMEHYDGNVVIFRYLDHKTKQQKMKKQSIDDFIDRLTQHIPDKFFKMIRYYGFLSYRTRTIILPKIYDLVGQTIEAYNQVTFVSLMKSNFNYNPLKCILCGSQLRRISTQFGLTLREKYSYYEERKRRYLGRYFAHPMMQNRRAKRDDYKPSAVRVTQRYVP
ncbi:Putative transposase [Piscirickettsia salmonis]|uniref:IS91 family transposase n=1 Tax=Piscirickettsia salmonis TaxID=1238 RepID=UPI0012BA7FA5|nr:IS91 family transposase [Piscirickettsia salmonis]QGP55000.1 Putative transposase [Piscirickettsia salmonis]QGP59127.1 Putative transposase [Piscirickettsia salmonis]QGP64569.1 Putative transposase [Piscirickettsia salmonis]